MVSQKKTTEKEFQITHPHSLILELKLNEFVLFAIKLSPGQKETFY